ncbi:MAG: right-handed parallel beta-helix repeat-containing protein [Patescibacteria group bacterium]|nr:right-handed parallel beta-helix repeat-containing protein [Patescibacteria group bacterium]
MSIKTRKNNFIIHNPNFIIQKGFILIDTLVGIALTLIVFLGIFGAYQLGLKVVGQSQNRITATALANQKIEELRNLNYASTTPGWSATTTELNNIKYTVKTLVQCIDGEQDGKAPNDENNCVCDYKNIKVKVSWSGYFGGEVFLHDTISPRTKTEECETPAGILDISVFDSQGNMVDSPDIEVRSLATGIAYSGKKIATGEYEYVIPPNGYAVTTTLPGYTTSRTYGSGEVYNGQTIATVENECWAHPHPKVFNAQRTEISFCIDKVSKFLIHTLEAKAEHIFYVRKVGSDDNDGLTPDTAFLTIQKAASSTAAGDMVIVGAGIYEEEVNIPSSGAAEKPIVFVADTAGTYTGDSGEVKIKGGNYGFYILNQRYLKIYGFKIENPSIAGISISGSVSKNIELINNKVINSSGNGIEITDASGVTLSHNDISGCDHSGIYLDNVDSANLIRNKTYQNSEEGIYAKKSGKALLKFNQSYSNSENGILISTNSNNCKVENNLTYLNSQDGIQIFDHVASIEVINNKSYSNSGSGIVFKKNISNANSIKSNLIYSNSDSGILLSENCVNNTITNNTSYYNQENGILIESDSNNNKLKNNIVVNNNEAGIQVSDSHNVESTYSNVWGNNPDYDGIEAGTGSISADPLFVDPDGPDNILGGDNGQDDSFHLSQIAAGQATDSPCVDAGSDTASALNMDKKTTRTDKVTDSGVVDMGFHYSLESPPPLPAPPDPFGPIIPNTNFHLRGEKMVGKTAEEKPIYKYSKDHQTNGSGFVEIPNLEWDSYHFSNFSAAGQKLDLIISYPSLPPIYLDANTTTTVKLGLRAENTLLVKVIDATTTEPVPFAGVRVYDTGYDRTQVADETGEVYFIPLSKGWYNIEAGATGYASSTDSVKVDGHTEKTIKLQRIE